MEEAEGKLSGKVQQVLFTGKERYRRGEGRDRPV